MSQRKTYFEKCQERIQAYKNKAAARVEHSREKIKERYDAYCNQKQKELDAKKAEFKARSRSPRG